MENLSLLRFSNLPSSLRQTILELGLKQIFQLKVLSSCHGATLSFTTQPSEHTNTAQREASTEALLSKMLYHLM